MGQGRDTSTLRVLDYRTKLAGAALIGILLKVLMFGRALGGIPSVSSFCATVGVIVLFGVGGSLVAGRYRLWVALGVSALISTLGVGDLLYFRYFHELPSFSSFRYAPQLWAVRYSVVALLRPADLAYFLDILIILASAAVSQSFGARVSRWASQAGWRRIGVGAAVVLMAPLIIQMVRSGLPQPITRQNRGAPFGTLGFLPYHIYDAVSAVLASIQEEVPASEAERRAAVAFIDSANRQANPSTLNGVARGLNLIVIMSESLQRFPMNRRINGIR